MFLNENMSENVIQTQPGQLIEISILESIFEDRPLTFINRLRKDLLINVPELCEKVNKNMLYFGFSSGSSDCMYIYLQKKKWWLMFVCRVIEKIY